MKAFALATLLATNAYAYAGAVPIISTANGKYTPYWCHDLRLASQTATY
jgi:hypothetical protein